MWIRLTASRYRVPNLKRKKQISTILQAQFMGWVHLLVLQQFFCVGYLLDRAMIRFGFGSRIREFR